MFLIVDSSETHNKCIDMWHIYIVILYHLTETEKHNFYDPDTNPFPDQVCDNYFCFILQPKDEL